ncbi:MAG: trypsin, partial [Treponema sp.]|nr:trypsin [Treponema sp.]
MGVFFYSCTTQEAAQKRLVPPKSIEEIRLDDVSKVVNDDPTQAIHLLETYKILYGSGSGNSGGNSAGNSDGNPAGNPAGTDPANQSKADELWNQALDSLKASQVKAVDEKRWTDAASLARSLGCLGIKVESTGEEPDLILEYAKEQLSQGNNLPAFLAAVRSNELKPMSFDDALLFLQRAVDVKQRRTAALFLSVA